MEGTDISSWGLSGGGVLEGSRRSFVGKLQRNSGPKGLPWKRNLWQLAQLATLDTPSALLTPRL